MKNRGQDSVEINTLALPAANAVTIFTGRAGHAWAATVHAIMARASGKTNCPTNLRIVYSIIVSYITLY